MRAATRGCAARENPFRTSRVHKLRYRLGADGRQRLLRRFERLGRRAALVGPEGSGNPTLPEDLEPHLGAGRRLLRLRLSRERRRLSNSEWERLANAGRGDLITVDGFEQLRWWHRRRLGHLSHGAGGLLVTCHRRLGLPVLHHHRTTLRLLGDLVTALVGRKQTEALEPELARLFATHRGNLRSCLRSLYDRWALHEPQRIY